MKITTLEKDGVRQEVWSPLDVARLKAAGYVEVKDAPQAAPPEAQAADFAEQQQEIVEEVLQPSKAKKGKK